MPPVSRIRLRIEERNAIVPCRYHEAIDPAGISRLIPLLRLATQTQLVSQTRGKNSVPMRALLDTGAWISAIETETWQEYDRDGLIEHLPLMNAQSALIAGYSTTYRLGRVWVRLLDPLPTQVNWLPAVPVMAQLLENEECRLSAPILLGIHLGVLDGRRLTREPMPPLAGPIPPNHSSDVGAWYGQQWYLESA
jgi:hypothetical protein